MDTKHLLMAIALGSAFSACKPDEPVPPGPGGGPPNEEELITTVELHFNGGGEHKHFTWRDVDGPGGNASVITADTLTAGVVYAVHIKLYNESVVPAEDVTLEVAAEADEHQFFFQVLGGAAVGITYDDFDVNNNPLGLETIWTVGAAGTGEVKVTLLHDPDKFAPGVSSNDMTNAGGETDIDGDVVKFPLVVR